MRKISTLPQLEQLQEETFMYAFLVVIVALAFAYLAANIISYKGGNDRSNIKRRVWFFIFGFISWIGFWLYNDQIVKDTILNTGYQSMFSNTNFKCLAITILGYLVGGFALMFFFPRTKFGSIFNFRR